LGEMMSFFIFDPILFSVCYSLKFVVLDLTLERHYTLRHPFAMG
jgi:hypothetical protein